MRPTPILVPADSRPLFERASGGGSTPHDLEWLDHGPESSEGSIPTPLDWVQCHYYDIHSLSSADKVKRRLGRLSAESAFRAKLTLPADGAGGAAQALWLSERVSLKPKEWKLFLDELPDLKWIFSQRTSYHHLQLDLFKDRGIALSNSGTLVSRWVAEFAFACIVAETKKIPQHAMEPSWFAAPIAGAGFTSRRVTILGTGNIGGHLAGMCRGVGMKVTGLSRNPERFGADHDPYDRMLHIDKDRVRAMETSDFVILAVPSADETQRIIGRAELAALPRGATLISVTHPEVIDQEAVFSSLREGNLGGAYLDRVEAQRGRRQPKVPGLVVTHNSHAHLPEKKAAAFRRFLRGVQALQEGKDPADRVV